jgi:hypothetical protein
LACPYFVPLEIVNDGSWPHPARLPLGAGWSGNCVASGRESPASELHSRQFCNLGYAIQCPHLPATTDWDAIRFSVARFSREQVILSFVCELRHAPIEHGKLTFDCVNEAWIESAADPRVLTLANRYVQTYRARQISAIAS